MRCSMAELVVGVLWIDVVDPVVANEWDLLVKGLLKERPVFSEGCNTCAGGSTPEDKDWGVGDDVFDVETTKGGCVFENRT